MDNFPLVWLSRYMTAFSMSLIISLALMPLSIFLLKKFNIMDQPNHRKIHTTPIPRMGGIVIYIAFALPMIFIMYFTNAQKGIIYGSGIALLIGAADDIWSVPAVVKLIALFALTVMIRGYGVATTLPFNLIMLNNDIFNLILTMVWLTGICSAINALDHMDALAGGIAIIAAICYFAVSVQTKQYFWGLMSLSLIGSILGFLVYNRHPAKIFMGDSGSFFLGFCLASIGIMGGWSTNPIKASIIPLAILSIPIFDLSYVIFARIYDGTTHSLRESITYCGKDHIGHRLLDIGFNQVTAVRLVYLIAGTVGVSALVIRYTKRLESLLLFFQIVMMYIILILFMRTAAKWKKENNGRRNSQ